MNGDSLEALLINALSPYILSPQLHLISLHTIFIAEEPAFLFRPFGANLVSSQTLGCFWILPVCFNLAKTVHCVPNNSSTTSHRRHLIFSMGHYRCFQTWRLKLFSQQWCILPILEQGRGSWGEGLSGLETSHTSTLWRCNVFLILTSVSKEGGKS